MFVSSTSLYRAECVRVCVCVCVYWGGGGLALSYPPSPLLYLLTFMQSIFFFFFLQLHLQHMEVPRPGVELKLHLQPTPQPWQHQIGAMSVAYTAACSKARSQTYWARPGIEPTSSERQHRSLTHWVTMGTPMQWEQRSFGECLKKINSYRTLKGPQ